MQETLHYNFSALSLHQLNNISETRSEIFREFNLQVQGGQLCSSCQHAGIAIIFGRASRQFTEENRPDLGLKVEEAEVEGIGA